METAKSELVNAGPSVRPREPNVCVKPNSVPRTSGLGEDILIKIKFNGKLRTPIRIGVRMIAIPTHVITAAFSIRANMFPKGISINAIGQQAIKHVYIRRLFNRRCITGKTNNDDTVPIIPEIART